MTLEQKPWTVRFIFQGHVNGHFFYYYYKTSSHAAAEPRPLTLPQHPPLQECM